MTLARPTFHSVSSHETAAASTLGGPISNVDFFLLKPTPWPLAFPFPSRKGARYGHMIDIVLLQRGRFKRATRASKGKYALLLIMRDVTLAVHLARFFLRGLQ
jgi:hypothetical protein